MTEAAVIAEAGARLLERLDFIRLQPRLVVDLEARQGQLTRLLAKYYRKARILVTASTQSLLGAARRQAGWFSRQRFIQADAAHLPLRDHSVDFIFANLLPPSAQLWQECCRLLVPGGLILFSTTGDIRTIGDELLRAGLCDPVVDKETIAARGMCPVEVIYGIGWGAKASDGGAGSRGGREVAIPIKEIKHKQFLKS